jgi:methylated-DNA-[protein]-cysteine S-methyltransferase
MPNASEFLFDRVDTPLGEAQLVCDARGRLRLFGWYGRDAKWKRYCRSHLGDIELSETRDPFGLSSAIDTYMQGNVHVIDNLPVAFSGTPFQETVWHALRTIPAGETLSYGALARQIGEPKAVRAVGLANGSNPIGLVVPCHRVIGSDGSLTGYGGGLERKKWLLDHEARCAGYGLFRKELRK